MTDFQRNLFKEKIKQADCVQLVIIVYEILLCYLNESLIRDVDNNLMYADRCVDELIKSINFDSVPSKELLSVYTFAKQKINLARAKEDAKIIRELIPLFEKFLETYKKIDKPGKIEDSQDMEYLLYDNKGNLYSNNY